MASGERPDLPEASLRFAPDSAIDGMTAIFLAHPNPQRSQSDFAIRRDAEGVLVGLHGMLVHGIAVPRFVEDCGSHCFGVTDGADETLVEILAFLETNLRDAIPGGLRTGANVAMTRLTMRFVSGWVQRRERVRATDTMALELPATPVELPASDLGVILQAAMAQAPFGVYVTDFDSAKPVINNPAHQLMFGYTAEEERLLEPEQFQDQARADDDFDLFADLVAGRIPFLERISSRPHKDGRSIPYHVLAWPVRDAAGKITHFFSLISPETRSEATSGSGLAEKRARFLLRLSPDPIVITTEQGEIRYASPSVGLVLGYDPDALIGKPVEALLAPSSAAAGRQMIADVAQASLTRIVSEVEIVLHDGSRRWFELVATNLLAVEDVQGIVFQGHDVTERRALHAELELAARSDPLTGLLNRRGFLALLQSWLDAHATPGSRGHAVACYLDLDTFKAINDRYGHSAGDAVLETLAMRLAELVEGRGFVGRIGGDEFVLKVALEDASARMRFEEDLHAALHGMVEAGGQTIAYAASYGLIVLRDVDPTGTDAAAILHIADQHLARSKMVRRASATEPGAIDHHR